MSPIDIRDEDDWLHEEAKSLAYNAGENRELVRESLVYAVEEELDEYEEVADMHVPAMAEDVVAAMSDTELEDVYREAVTVVNIDPETISSLEFVEDMDAAAAAKAVERYIVK